MSPAFNHDFTATNTVFATHELVGLIVEQLDELSLVRTSGVNCTFRAVILQSTTLQRKLGIGFSQPEVLSTKTIRLKEVTYDTAWNPLIDWFLARQFTDSGFQKGPITRLLPDQAFTLIVLPHALRAAGIPNSSIHRMSATIPPVDKLPICIDWGCTKLIVVENQDGVKIGDVFGRLGLEPPEDPHEAIALYMPWNEAGPGGSSVRDTLWTHMGVSELLDDEMVLWYDACGMDWRFDGQKTERTLNESILATASDDPLLCTMKIWAKQVICLEHQWFEMSMEEQGRVIRDVFKTQRRAAKEETWSLEVEHPLWPALGLATEEEGIICPYEVDYACGVVFNSQAVDLANIRLPYN